jgi:hypothetical protein
MPPCGYLGELDLLRPLYFFGYPEQVGHASLADYLAVCFVDRWTIVGSLLIDSVYP